ncbi:MAG: hypothetical protein K2H61_01700 [Muribaculaceae bacterium]|nr:hypothetical protein [Muribaculaceae bacterium]
MNFKLIISATLLAGALTASAQDLTKDITIERSLNPTLRAATRLSTSPRLFQPEIKFQPLTFNENAIQIPLSASIDTLPAANPQALIEPSYYRGYAQAGYFPGYNLMVSAGYNIINRSATTLGIWAQFDGDKYNATTPLTADDYTMHLGRNAASAGIDLAAIIARAGRLDINADFTWARQHTANPLAIPEPEFNSVTEFNATANWSARLPQMAYYAKVDFSNFSRHIDKSEAPTQNIFSINGGTAYFFDEHSQLAGSIGAKFQATSDYIVPLENRTCFAHVASRTIGIIDFKPAYRYVNSVFKLNIGINLQFTSHINKSINLAPDIHLYYTPVSAFTAYVKLTGGKRLNPISELYDYCPYFNPQLAFNGSNVPLEAKFGFAVGPFSGFDFSIEGAYAKANQWLMPCNVMREVGTTDYYYLDAVDLSGFQVTLKAGYELNRYLKAELAYSRAGNGEKSAYYLNRDRAANILGASVSSNPIDPLTVDLSFTLRSGRSQFDYVLTPDNQLAAAQIKMKSASSLNIGANYRITHAFSVFARVENLLNCRADQVLYLPMQGVHGAIGASVKF